MRTTSLMLFVICVNVAAWIMNMSGFYPLSQSLWLNPAEIVERFALSIFASAVATGGLTGVISLLTKSNVFASYALVVWVVGELFLLGMWFLGGVPVLLEFIIPTDLWFIRTAITAFCTVIFFLFLMEVTSQRQWL